MTISVSIPDPIKDILHSIEQKSCQAYLVGGCVRDILMGKSPNDWDICTDMLPHEIQRQFPGSLDFGIKHGTVTVCRGDVIAEITTFRAESGYADHRRPDHVTFIHDLNQDLARRDFTVNAVAMDSVGQIRDPFGGQDDIGRKLLRAVGKPASRFREDALRMLRAVRFSAQLGFCVEDETMKAIRECAPLSKTLAAERVCSEIEKTILSPRPERISLMSELALLKTWGLAGTIDNAELLNKVSPDRVSRWMGLSLLVDDFSTVFRDLRLDHHTLSACADCGALKNLSPRQEIDWKYAVEKFGVENTLQSARVLTDMQMIDSLPLLERILARGDCLSLETLAVDGRDAASLGLQGKEIGIALRFALHYVFENPKANDKETLLQLLKKEYAIS